MAMGIPITDPADPSPPSQDRLPPLECHIGGPELAYPPPRLLAQLEPVVHSGSHLACQWRWDHFCLRRQCVLG